MSEHAWPNPLPPLRFMRFFVTGIIAFCLLATAGRAEEQMPVTVFIARQSPVTEQISVVGTLAAREEIQVYPAVTGKEIRQILVEAGQTVKASQPLALLDTTDAMLALDKNAVSALRARAAVAVEGSKVDVAMVSEREARKKLERNRQLQPKGAVSDQVLEEHQNAHERALAELGLARQALALAQADEQLIGRERKEIELTIERSTLRAPNSGFVLERSARIGAMSSNSAGPLFRIAAAGMIEFVAEVTETSFVRLREGMQAKIVLPGHDEPVIGTLRLNAAQLDPKTRCGTVRIELRETEGLVAGVFARGVIDTATRTNILLPGTAVKSTHGASSVYVVRNDTVEVRKVRIGSQQNNAVEITEGVSDGEMVVLKAGGFLKDRERVTPVLAATETALSRELSEAVSDTAMGTVRQ